MFKKLFLIIFSAGLVFNLFSTTTNAEDDIDCTGRIEGQVLQSNVNIGTITFDAHPYNVGQKLPEDSVYNVNANLGVVGLGDGLAPANRSDAACISEKSGAAVSLGVGEFAIRGYSWSENLGFISFNCDSCGANKYGVKITPDGVGGYNVSGYAWNEAFGYISMSSAPGDVIAYGVKVAADGKVSGYAYSAAGVYINFSAVTFFLPGATVKPVVLANDYCNKPKIKPVCVQLDPDPDTLKSKSSKEDAGAGGGAAAPSGGIDDGVKIADGKDFYQMHLYLRDAAGVALDPKKLDQVNFTWEDSVKADQTAEGEKKFDNNPKPIDGGGGVIYKPTILKKKADLDKYFEPVGPLKDGHYKLKPDYTVRSYAPTTNENFSYTTSTTPPFPVNNETFFTNVSAFNSANIKPNVLKLKSLQVTYDGKALVPVYPNGKDGLSLRFRPAFEVKMFANNAQDSILGVRGIPVNYYISGAEFGNLEDKELDISFKLDYDKETTKIADLNCSQDGGSFLIHFLKDFNDLEQQDTQNVLSVDSIDDISSSKNLQSLAKLVNEESPCTNVSGPTLYSKVFYKAGGKPFAYFSDKLPRVTSQISNPVAVVHGNIIASKAFSPNAEKSVQETGNVAVNIIRNTIHETVETRLKAELKNKNLKQDGKCKITAFGKDENVSVSGCDVGHYETFSVEDEHAIYFKGSDVHLNLTSFDKDAKWVVIVEDGNIFVDSNIYYSEIRSLSLVSLRPYSSGCNIGNIYIHKDVKNIQANMFTDCSVFSYVDEGNIDKTDGTYKWTNFMEMVVALANQLKIEGSIASHNTIGGADTDKLGYLRDGFGKISKLPVSADNRLRLQQYDLNFLRLSKGELMKAENGLPIDQSCKKALSVEEILAVQKYNQCVELGICDGDLVEVFGDGGEICDGIDPLNFVADGGDLVPVLGNLAAGLELGEYYPVYVYYVKTDSFIFSTRN